MARLHRHAAWLTGIALVVGVSSTAGADVLPWQGDGPQPHGPGGTLLVDHQPSNFGGLASDTLINEAPGWQRVADDFSISQSAVIQKLVWWGFYDMNILPANDDIFRIRVYDRRPVDFLPGSILYEQSFTNVQRTWTGRFVLTFGAPQELRYEIPLTAPIALPAAASYWLQIVQDGDVNSHFRWEQSNFPPLNGLAFTNPIAGDWTPTASTSTNASFQLISIPEPSSLSVLAIGAGFLINRHRGSSTILGSSSIVSNKPADGRVKTSVAL